jgi:ribosome-associated protein
MIMHDDIENSAQSESKTRRKQRMTELQGMGEELLALNKRQLDLIALPDILLIALREYQRLPNRHEAKRRQLQFIGKLMRKADHENIRTALDRLKVPDRQEVRRSQDIERWGEKLLSGNAETIEEFLLGWPLAERQVLRRLVRRYQDLNSAINSANDEQAVEAVKVARRRLLDYIKTVIV